MSTEETKVKFCEKSFENGVLSFKFGNGTHLTLDVTTLDQETQTNLMGHGGLQKIGDSYAGAAGDYEFAIEAASKVIKNLQDGVWKATREGSGESKPRVTELAEAVARLKGIELEQAVAVVSALSDEQRKELRARDKVKEVIAQIRYEKAAAKSASNKESAEELLASLGI